jgi:DEAD/DEAH box helicase domain-containing protein
MLIDDRVSLIDQSGAPQGEKHFLLYNPPLIDPKLGLRKSSVQTSVNLGLSLLEFQPPVAAFRPHPPYG